MFLMTLFSAVLSGFAPTAQAAWTPADCPASLNVARAAAAAADSAYRAGRTGLTERDNANLDLLAVKFNCRLTPFAAYCAEAAPLASEAAQSAIRRSPVNPDLLLQAQLRNGRVSQMCRPPGSR